MLPAVRLSDFILDNLEPILQAWEDFARTIEPPALTMDDRELRDHAIQMLQVIAADLAQRQTAYEQIEKSKGNAPDTGRETPAQTHAAARLLSGYTVEQLVSEYRALRASVLKQWAASAKTTQISDADDITRFNEAIDQALAESVARYAELIQQSQNMFLAILGHDLRNPLGTIITGASFIMGAADVGNKYVLAATHMFSSGQRMNKLIADLIDFTRTRLGAGLPIKPKQTDIAEICLNVVEELRIYHPERIIKLDKKGELTANADEDRIAQVFSNVIGNALQYGEKNESINVSLYADSNSIVAKVNNKGPVIDSQKMGAIFEPLVRLTSHDSTDYSRDSSLGIGLYIAKQIVQAHSGTISVSSNQVEGTSFTFTLPRS
jgi:signal transduction histidine kinase